MSETKPGYHITPDVMVVDDTWEAKALTKLRQLRKDWLKNNRRIFVMMDIDGNMFFFMSEPCGRIEIG